jgi:acetyl-CoA carboxylase biotin carboxyl carrier protein
MPGKNVGREEREARAWTLKDIEQLLDLLVAREISEFEMEKDGLKLRIKRDLAHEPPSSAALSSHHVSQSAVGESSPVAANASTARESAAESSTEDLYIIKSPMVGTFYGAPSPNAPPFVKPGDVVQVGQVLCIIEAMKLMNDIESEVAGEIVRIYVENGQPVEYGQSLFAVKPSHKK